MTKPVVLCDFCGVHEPTWEFPAESYLEPTLDTQSVDGWLACEACAYLICSGNWETLAQRTVECIMGDDGSPIMRAFLLTEARRLHQNFTKHRTGEPVRL